MGHWGFSKCYWALALAAIVVPTCGLAQSNADLEDGTTGVDNSDMHDGLTPDQIKKLDKKTQDVINRFNKGRSATSKGGGGRYSGTLEMHDADFDGVTDHGNANNALEGGQEDAALGKGNHMTGGDKRNEALRKAKLKAGKCTGKAVEECDNISANLVDRGPAHGQDTPQQREKHRVYELTDESKKNAADAGKAYGNQVLKDAASYDASGARGVRNVGADKSQVEVFSGRKGWVKQDVAASPELLRSEAAWLEEQKARNVQNGWKMLRAKRLIDQIKYANERAINWEPLGSLAIKYKKNPNAPDELVSDHELSELVNGIYRSASPSGDTSKEDAQLMSVVSQKAAAEMKRRKDWLAAQPNSAPGMQADKKEQAEKQKQLQIDNAMLAKCMAQDAWCTSKYRLDEKAFKKFEKDQAKNSKDPQSNLDLVDVTKVGQDVGSAYDDTREYIYNRVDQARRQSLSNNVNNVRNLDFNENSDKKAGAKIFSEYKRDAERANALAEAYKKDTQCMGDQDCMNRVVKATGRPYVPTPASAGYDPRTQNAAQLSKRNNSNGSTLARPMAPTPSSGFPAFGPNVPQQPRTPATAGGIQ